MKTTSIVSVLALCLLSMPRPTLAQESMEIDEAVNTGITLLLEMQEGKASAQWPYEGVYRVRRQIPIGYRVGGTSIAATALVRSPGYQDDAERQEAVQRATAFVVTAMDHPLMQPAFSETYDVRVWGYSYGLAYLLELQARDIVPDGMDESVEKAIRFWIDSLEANAIPKDGGWNYSRRAGTDKPGNPSPFMTGPTLQALFEAIRQGYEVDPTVIDAGLDALENARTATGAVVYSGSHGARSAESVPGSVGRMLVTEVTLKLGGRGSVERIRGALDAFIVHWKWLDKRRAQTGTHVKPYGVAPYYFYYAHYYAAQAIEQLPERERAEYRRRLHELLFSVRLDDGSWNDRVFDRSANFGTAMAMMSLMMPDTPAPTPLAPAAPDADAAESRGL